MNLSTYIQRTRALGGLEVSVAEIDAIAESLATSGASLETVLNFQSDRLTPFSLLVIWRAFQMHQIQQDYLELVIRRRHQEGLAPIPSTLLKRSLTRHEVSVIERADVLAPESTRALTAGSPSCGRAHHSSFPMIIFSAPEESPVIEIFQSTILENLAVK